MEKDAIEKLAAKYGWKVAEQGNVLVFLNRVGKEACTVSQKGDRYNISDMTGSKLLTGNKSAMGGVETVLTHYYFAKPVTKPR